MKLHGWVDLENIAQMAKELPLGGLTDSLMLTPLLATLHDDPRWTVFLEKMGLSE